MAGNAEGGRKAAITNKLRHGENFYRIQGKIGGHKGSEGKGFAANRELASRAGRKGGLKSRRKPKPKAGWMVSDKDKFKDGFNQHKLMDRINKYNGK